MIESTKLDAVPMELWLYCGHVHLLRQDEMVHLRNRHSDKIEMCVHILDTKRREREREREREQGLIDIPMGTLASSSIQEKCGILPVFCSHFLFIVVQTAMYFERS